MRRDGVLCDVFLKAADDGVVPAHKIILAAVSPFFRAMFAGAGASMVEGRTQDNTISLKGVDTAGLRVVVEAIYEGQIELSLDNIEAVVDVASQLDVPPVLAASVRHLQQTLDESTCLWSLALASRYHLEPLREQCLLRARRAFSSIVHDAERSAALAALDRDAVRELLMSDDLNLNSEVDIFLAAVLWVSGDEASRLAELPGLLSTIRFPLLRPEEVERSMLCHATVRKSPDATQLLESVLSRGICKLYSPSTVALSSHAVLGKVAPAQAIEIKGRRSDASRRESADRLRRGSAGAESWSSAQERGELWGSSAQAASQTWAAAAPKWSKHTDGATAPSGGAPEASGAVLRGSDAEGGASVLGSGLRVSAADGGGTPATRWGDVHVVAEDSVGWLPQRTCDVDALLSEIRSLPRCSVASGFMVTGGFEAGFRGLKSSEIYDAARDSWRPGPDLPVSHTFLASASVMGMPIVVGGSTVSSYVARFIPDAWRWVPLAPLPTTRVQMGVTGCGGAVLAMGGRSGCGAGVERRCVEALCPHEADPQWRELPSLVEARSALGAAALGSATYAVGGQSGRAIHRTVEWLDIASDGGRWVVEDARMATGRKYHSVVALRGRILALGGMDAQRKRLSTVEAFDPREGRWHNLTAMSCARSSFGAAVVSGRAYVVGGSATDEEIHRSAECYVEEMDAWLSTAPMTFPRSALATLPI
ncbi:unnamed protein product [Pedinophyceae sp. YPF-701]|nr:unnamed protein product [Pedinophyceae sp. YPF-701]